MPKVSVIIPVYNVEKYLRECLDSVVNQTLKDIEIICVNDGSTDGSLKILEEYAQKDGRVLIINQENKGVGAARNRGLEIAQGEYLGFCDPDDWLDVDFYEKLYEASLEGAADIVKGNFKIINFDKRVKILEENEKIAKELEETIIPVKTFCTGWISAIYKTASLKNFNILFPKIMYKEDVAFLYKFLFISQKFVLINDTFYNYLKRKNSLTNKKLTYKNFQDYFVCRKNVQEFLNCNYIDKDKYLLFFEEKVVKALLRDLAGVQTSCKDKEFREFCNLSVDIINKCIYRTELFSKIKDRCFHLLIKKDYSGLKRCFLKNLQLTFWQKIFSVKNNKNHKIVTLLGIRFVFKRGEKNG